MTFKLLIKDYDSYQALSSKKIQIKNTDSKQSYMQISNANGELIFEIEESQKGYFFSITIIDEGYEATPYYLAKDSAKRQDSAMQKQDSTKNTTQKILTPNNYQTHPAILYFKAHISLLFNGYNLLILKGDLILKSYKARSGKALNAQEKQDLQINKGYKDFIADGEVFYCLNKDWQKQDCALLPEGDYYIKAQSSKDIQIYTDKTCHNIAKSKKDSFYIHSQGNFEGIKLVESAYFLEYLNTYTQERSIFLKVAYSTQNSNQITFILQADSKEQLDLEAPFAQGTYIELEAKTLKQVEHITWGYVKVKNKLEKQHLLNETTPINDFKAIRLDEANERFYKRSDNKNTLSYQIGFHLPLCDDEFEYIIIFAFDSNVKTLPNITDAHLILNINFKASSDMPKSTLTNNYQSLLHWNQKSCISIYEAVAFLKANINKMQNYESDIDYFTNYPQLAGKIAYMYFCFDMSKEEFVERVTQFCYAFFQCKDSYKKDREEFIDKVVEVFDTKQHYLQNQTFSQKYKELFETHNPNNTKASQEIINARKQFLEYLTFEIIKALNLPYPRDFILDTTKENPYKNIIIFFDEKEGWLKNSALHNGYVENGKIYLNSLHLQKGNFTFSKNEKYFAFRAFITFEHLLNTVFHEIRHFYIIAKYSKNDRSMLKKYLYWNLRLYIENYYFFKGFYKLCDSLDSSNVGCIINEKQNAYEIQPSERDARFVATKIIKQLKAKGLL